MNVIGNLGELIVEFQYPIEIILLSILGVIFVVFIAKGILNSVRRKQVINDISEAVSDIKERQGEIILGLERLEHGSERFIKTNFAEAEDNKEPDKYQKVNIDEEVKDIDECTSCKALGIVEINSDEVLEDCSKETEKDENKMVEVFEEEIKEDEDQSKEELEKKAVKFEKIEDGKETEAEPPKKYLDRECSINKFGKVYTEEELQEQIK